MILNELILTNHVDDIRHEDAIDSRAYCVDIAHFLSYTKVVYYTYNERGFRDDPWPETVNNDIWCLGDSFTVGLGQPYEEIWPRLIQQKTDSRVFNISLNGGSNDWISRKTQHILEHANPKYIFIQWSYLHRRESPNQDLIDEDRRLHYVSNGAVDPEKDQRDIDNFLKNVKPLLASNIVHSFVPQFADTKEVENKIYEHLTELGANFFPQLEVLDRARDGHHYDILTSQNYANEYWNRVTNISQ
jgi:hypothetical protein